MVSDPSDPLREFLRDNVSSYEGLEALLYLARNPGMEWSATEVAGALKVSVESMEDALGELTSAGRLVAIGRRAATVVYRYAPIDSSIEQRVSDLRQAYEDQRLSVVQMMSGNALDRVRRAAMLRLADAFRLKPAKP